jgi:catechol 2,3-dioxygenase-like lactoylglutathione lyase family enzyme
MLIRDILIFVKDLDRMTAFYRDVVGLRPIAETRMDDWVEFEAGPVRLGLHRIPPQIAETIRIADPPAPRESSVTKMIFQVADVDAEAERLRNLNVPVLVRAWGGRDFVDPEGNVLGLQAR